MQRSNLLSFLCGALVVLGLGTVVQSNAQSPKHIYELRIYHANPGKLQALEARFANTTDRIFRRHNMNPVGYFVPLDNPQNLFIYILEHPSKAEADKNWPAFQTDPEWVKARTESEVNGVLNDHVDRTFMEPTDFSRMK